MDVLSDGAGNHCQELFACGLVAGVFSKQDFRVNDLCGFGKNDGTAGSDQSISVRAPGRVAENIVLVQWDDIALDRAALEGVECIITFVAQTVYARKRLMEALWNIVKDVTDMTNGLMIDALNSAIRENPVKSRLGGNASVAALSSPLKNMEPGQ